MDKKVWGDDPLEREIDELKEIIESRDKKITELHKRVSYLARALQEHQYYIRVGAK